MAKEDLERMLNETSKVYQSEIQKHNADAKYSETMKHIQSSEPKNDENSNIIAMVQKMNKKSTGGNRKGKNAEDIQENEEFMAKFL